jgi:hypothetical protein
MKPSRLWAASLSTALMIIIASAASATPPNAVIAPADGVTIEILESNSDFVNRISLWGPSVDLMLTDDDTGAMRTIRARAGREIKLQIAPYDSTNTFAVGGPWRSGPGDRNGDGQVHARVTTAGTCSLVEFEDLDASDWGAVDEPNFVDAILHIYPTGPKPSSCPMP